MSTRLGIILLLAVVLPFSWGALITGGARGVVDFGRIAFDAGVRVCAGANGLEKRGLVRQQGARPLFRQPTRSGR